MISRTDPPSSRLDEIEHLAEEHAASIDQTEANLTAASTPRTLALLNLSETDYQNIKSIISQLSQLARYTRSISAEGSGPPPPPFITETPRKNPDPFVFISHRHDDKSIADVLNRHIQKWHVRPSHIFQSSAPRHGLLPGDHLTSTLGLWLRKANLLILVYTSADEDWSYCLWECGVATDPLTPRTRVVVFRCGDENPKVYQECLSVEMKKDSIKSFVHSFFKQQEFFFTTEAFFQEINDETVFDLASALYDDLAEVIRYTILKTAPVRRWNYMRVALSSEHVRKIQEQLKMSVAYDIIQNNAEIESNTSASALLLFGYHCFQDGLKLSELLNRWTAVYDEADKAWIRDLCKEMVDCINNRPPHMIVSCLKSVQESLGWCFRPIITSYCWRRDGSCEFDIYFYPEPTDMVPRIT